MKRTQKILVITYIAVIIILIIIAILLYIRDNKVEEFKLSEYQDIINI